MKNTSPTKRKSAREDGLRSEYRFDYAKAKPNRFAARATPGAVAVLLEPDVARIFKTSKSVNTALRALINVMPPRRTPSIQ